MYLELICMFLGALLSALGHVCSMCVNSLAVLELALLFMFWLEVAFKSFNMFKMVFLVVYKALKRAVLHLLLSGPFVMLVIHLCCQVASFYIVGFFEVSNYVAHAADFNNPNVPLGVVAGVNPAAAIVFVDLFPGEGAAEPVQQPAAAGANPAVELVQQPAAAAVEVGVLAVPGAPVYPDWAWAVQAFLLLFNAYEIVPNVPDEDMWTVFEQAWVNLQQAEAAQPPALAGPVLGVNGVVPPHPAVQLVDMNNNPADLIAAGVLDEDVPADWGAEPVSISSSEAGSLNNDHFGVL